jgi:hypothetical protein
VPLADTSDCGVKPVPVSVSLNAAPPAAASLGLMLVSVRGVATVLKFANTRVNPH